MALEGEWLCLATGLLQLPKREHLSAARAYPKQVLDAIKTCIDRDDVAAPRVFPDRKTYFDALVKVPLDYSLLHTSTRLPAEVAIEFQITQQRARDMMVNRHPVTTVSTLVGPVDTVDSFDETLRYSWSADAMENHLRLPWDMAASVLLPSTVKLVALAYPGVYRFMNNATRDAVAAKKAKEKDWIPPLWLDSSIRVMLQLGWTENADLTQPAEGKVKLSPTTTATPAQGLSNQGRTPPARR